MKTKLLFVFAIFLSLSVSAQEKSLGNTTSAVRLFSDRDDLTSVLTIIPKGSIVEVVKNDGEYLVVNYEDYQGYIPVGNVIFDQVQEAVSEEQIPVDTNVRQKQQIVDRYDRLMGKYGYHLGKLFYDHKIWKGLSTENVIDSWGKPSKMNRTYNDNDLMEEWIYSKKWLLFQNDVLVNWGSNR